jgi:hypothetical protein
VEAVSRASANCFQQGFTPWNTIGDAGVALTNLTTPRINTKSVGYETDIPFWVTNTPGTQKYLKAVKKYAPQIWKSPNYDEESLVMYVSALLSARH